MRTSGKILATPLSCISLCRYLLYSDLISCLTDLRNSLNVRLRASDGRALSFFHNLFFFLILLRISLEIHMKINLPLFHSKGWIHILATASNKSFKSDENFILKLTGK